LSWLVEVVRKLFARAYRALFNHRYHLDDIINIVRPFIYVYSIIKYGHKSYTPVKISLLLDLIGIVITLSRLIQASNGQQAPSQDVQGGQQSSRHYVEDPNRSPQKNTRRLKQIEKKELMRRIWNALIKYLIRDPIFEDYTQPIALKVFTTLRISPRIFGVILGIVSYFRYYAYIA